MLGWEITDEQNVTKILLTKPSSMSTF